MGMVKVDGPMKLGRRWKQKRTTPKKGALQLRVGRGTHVVAKTKKRMTCAAATMPFEVMQKKSVVPKGDEKLMAEPLATKIRQKE